MRTPANARVIHWLSPLPPAPTDIAEYTRRILPALARRAKVVLWTDQRTWDPGLARHAEVQHLDPSTFSPARIAELRRELGIPATARDAVFVHIGNNWAFHAGLLAVARRMPSVVVLHDLVIQEMLLDAVAKGRLARDAYLDAIAATYSGNARETAVEALEGRPEAREAIQAHSGADLATRRALAVITHAAGGARYFARPPAGGIAVLNLPYPSDQAAPPRRLRSGPLRLLLFGHVGPNRRLLEILDALGALHPRLDFRFDVGGQVWDEQIVRGRIAALGLEDRVTLHGFLPEAMLDRLISEAHLVFNLRYPTMGEASGSQLRIWSRAACAVVSDIGWYTALPEGSVLKLPAGPDAEAEGLAPLLMEIDADRPRFAAIGRQGFEHLCAHHDPNAYVEEICRIADTTAGLSRGLLMRECVDRHPHPLNRDAAQSA